MSPPINITNNVLLSCTLIEAVLVNARNVLVNDQEVEARSCMVASLLGVERLALKLLLVLLPLLSRN